MRVTYGKPVQMERDKSRAKCRKWRLVVRIDGRQKTKVFDGAWREACAALEAFARDCGIVDEGQDVTLAEWTEEYIRRRQAAGNVSEKTVKKMRDYAKSWNMHLGDAVMSEIEPSDLEDMYAAMADGDTLSGKPSSGTYMSSINSTLYGVFRRAVRDKVLKANPLDFIERPQPDTAEKPALETEKAVAVLDALDMRNAQHVAVLLMLGAGLRRSEAAALLWDDVDMERGVIHVRKSKTDAGVRDVPMLPPLRRQLMERSDYMGDFKWGAVCSDTGYPMSPHSITTWFRRNAASIGAEGATPHVMRHTFASMMAEAGVHPVVMAKLLGHASASTSTDIYSHVRGRQTFEAMESVALLIGK